MTDEQKARITEMRLQGLGYQSIANELNLTKANVRYYCKTHGLIGASDLIPLNYDVHREMSDHCKNCGGKIERNPHSGVKLFCCDKCRRLWWKAHPNDAAMTKKKQYTLTCEYCHTPFISFGKPDRKYCSHDCYITDRFWTDPDLEVTADEIKMRQKAKAEVKVPKELKLRRIS